MTRQLAVQREYAGLEESHWDRHCLTSIAQPTGDP
jgi:hypothetical protein